MKTKIAYGYARVSTGKQAKEGDSIEMQLSCITEMARRDGVKLADIFSDEGFSGRKDTHKRVGYNGLLALVKEKKVDIIYAYSLSRIGRKITDILSLFDLCEKAGVDIVTHKESIDTRNAIGKLIRNILISFNEFEADLASERTSDVAQSKKKELKPYCNPPYGWKIVGKKIENGKVVDHGKLTEDTEEQKVIQWILEKRAANKSFSWIAKELNYNQIKPKRGNSWSHPSVQSVIETTQSFMQIAQNN